MSYKFIPGKMYRMPVQFGPGLGPRQLPEGVISILRTLREQRP